MTDSNASTSEAANAGGGFVIVNPYTGELARQADKFTISQWMRDTHRRLSMGAVGRQIVAISSIIFAITCIIGLILWWPLRGRTFQRAIRRRRALDWHNALGLVTIGPLIIMALTGALLTYGGTIFPWLEKTFQSEPGRPADPVVDVVEGRSKTPLSGPLATVQENFPEGQVTGIQPGGSAKSPYVFFVKSDGLNYRVCMNPYTGEEMSRFDGKAKGLIGNFRQNYFKYHTLHFNQLTGTIWGLLSAIGAVLIATGLRITIAKWRRKARRVRA